MRISHRIPSRIFIIVVASLVVIFTSLGRVFSRQELFFYDLHFQLRPTAAVDKDIVLIEISDETLQSLGFWPLPRDFHATLVDVLKSLGARQIVFDLLLSEPTAFDATLAEAARRAGCVYLPEAYYMESAVSSDGWSWPSSQVLGGITDVLKGSIFGYGHINVQVDPDGKVRRIPLYIRSGEERVPSLGLKAACDVLGIDSRRVSAGPGGRITIDGQLTLPVSQGVLLVDYPGTWKETFRHVSYIEILRAFKAKAEGRSPGLDLSVIRNKTCFIGLTATGTSDFRANPIENVYPMVGLQASVFNSVLERRFLREVAPWGNALLAWFVFLLSLAIGVRVTPRYAFFLGAAVIALYFLLAHGLFVGSGVWIDFFWPAAVVAATYVGCLFYRFLREVHERQLLEKELSIARTIQDNFLPRNIAPLGNVSVTAFMQPAKFVAGDLYDVIVLGDNRLGVLIGDVAGKGVPAALIMAQTVSCFRILSRRHASAAETLSAMNKELAPILQGRFVTAIYLVIDTQNRTFVSACAGHSPMMVYRSGVRDVAAFVTDGGPPIGIVEDVVYRDTPGALSPGDKILLFTDGITEARSGAEEYGTQRLADFFKENGTKTGRQIVDGLTAAVVKFQGSLPQHDDLTSVLVEIH
jgi:serine phosphatase RsbU (regulator of sigma subunit)/CHASE2 domain-containing sensor protein